MVDFDLQTTRGGRNIFPGQMFNRHGIAFQAPVINGGGLNVNADVNEQVVGGEGEDNGGGHGAMNHPNAIEMEVEAVAVEQVAAEPVNAEPIAAEPANEGPIARAKINSQIFHNPHNVHIPIMHQIEEEEFIRDPANNPVNPVHVHAPQPLYPPKFESARYDHIFQSIIEARVAMPGFLTDRRDDAIGYGQAFHGGVEPNGHVVVHEFGEDQAFAEPMETDEAVNEEADEGVEEPYIIGLIPENANDHQSINMGNEQIFAPAQNQE